MRGSRPGTGRRPSLADLPGTDGTMGASKRAGWPGLLERIALMGTGPGDSDELRAQKETLVIAVSVGTVLAVAWVGTYLVLGLPVSAAIPFVYQVISVASLIAFARTKSYRLFRASQLLLMLALPFL